MKKNQPTAAKGSKKKSVSNLTFLKLFRSYVTYHEKTSDQFEKRKIGTINCYTVKYNTVNEFLIKINDVSLTPFRVNTKFVQKLHEWMRDEKKYSHNYIVRVTGLCKLVLVYGIKQELIKINNLANYTTRRLPPKEPPYFSPQEIKAFENYKSSNEGMQKAADMFVIQLHTGFDYGDFKEMSRDFVVNYKDTSYVIKPRHKNGNKQIIPLSAKLRELLEKYNYNIQLLGNPQYNLAIKKIAKELEIKAYLTAKAGRKLFFMNKLNNEGYSIQAVSKMGGHSTISTTETYYARVDISLIHGELAGRML